MVVMIVDDDMDAIEFLIEVFKQIDRDIEGTYAFNGLEARRLLQHTDKKPVCIFLDLNVPKMGGSNFLKRIKEPGFSAYSDSYSVNK